MGLYYMVYFKDEYEMKWYMKSNLKKFVIIMNRIKNKG